MAHSKSITPAEWEVCRIVWTTPRLTSREIIDAMLEISDWKEGTIKTLIHRLRQKGFLTVVPDSRPFQFEMVINEQEAINHNLQSIVDQTCTNTHVASFSYLIQANHLSKENCDDLIQLLKEKKQVAPEQLLCNCSPHQCNC